MLHLRFQSLSPSTLLADDLSKIDALSKLVDLSLNQNPLISIPALNNTSLKSLALEDTSIISAEFPSSYNGHPLQVINLSSNKIRALKSTDFQSLKNSKVTRLHLDSASLTTIDQDAFTPLQQLQSLSLVNNQLKSAEFITSLRLLSSVHFDNNRFVSLPQQLAMPNNIKSFFFRNNSIAVIDDSSPLYVWQKKNWTNINIHLANNPFDCCQSLWFIRFLKASAVLVPDASSLRCASPADYAGQDLIRLNPDAMNCGSSQADKRWWTFGRILGVASVTVCVVFVAIAATIAVAVRVQRGRSARSGYAEIGGVNDPLPTVPTLPPGGLPFPPYGEENDAVSTYSTAPTMEPSASQADTYSTFVGVSAADEKHV